MMNGWSLVGGVCVHMRQATVNAVSSMVKHQFSCRWLIAAILLSCAAIAADKSLEPQVDLKTVVNAPQFLPLFAETLPTQGQAHACARDVHA